MPKLKIETVTTLHDFLRHIETLIINPADPYWFRGEGDSTNDLLHSLYRHPTKKKKGELLDIERSLIHRFKERSVPYLTANLNSVWEYVFLMQHYGVPTRLLDWTENPMIALFFALTSAQRDQTTGKYLKDAAVWAFSPRLWNATVFAHVSYDRGPLSVSDRLLKPYAPLSEDGEEPPALPAAIFGIHNSPRIVAQRGVFTIFGSNISPVQDIFMKENYNDNALVKYLIPPNEITVLLQKLLSTGYTEGMIFPGLDGLAMETKRLFGFED
jgi:hypothetical protein